MDSRPLSCLQRGSIVNVLKITMLDKYDILSRRVLVQHVSVKPQDYGVLTEGWASVQSSQGYVILSPLASVCYSNSRWGGTRPIIRQCGHAAHLKCAEAHTLSLHQRAAGEQPYDGRFAANIDDGEFLCPLCKQLSNILIPRDSFVGVSSSENISEVTMQEVDEGTPDKSAKTTIEEPHLGLRGKIAMVAWPSKSKAKRLSVMGREALKDFGAHLFQAMDVPWERQIGWRSQAQLHPAILRWDYEEEDEVGDDNKSNDAPPKGFPRGRSILRLLRQQHIAWAALGHSAAALEASTRGLEEVLPFGVVSSTADPWPAFNAGEKDKHPMLLELKRTVAGVSGLYEVLTEEASFELGFAKSDSRTPSVVGVLLADILDGNSWFQCVSGSSMDEEKERLVLWSQLTCLMTSIPCHVARDGQLSKRSEARASAAAMWTIKGLGTQRKKRSDPPAPLAISKISETLKKTDFSEIVPGWGTLDPHACGLDNAPPKLPFRPAVACAFLYTPLLAWDLNTMAGALFSSILANDIQDLPTSQELLYLAQSLLVSRIIQSIITPGGIVPSSDADVDDSMAWCLQDIEKEGSALSQLALQCRTRLKQVTATDSQFHDDITESEAVPMFSAVGEALLPFSRSIILLLRSCTAVIRERQGLSRAVQSETEFDQRLDSIMYSADLMSSDEGFVVYKAFDGPLPSSMVQKTSPWWTKIEQWLVAAAAWEAHHGCDGRSVIPSIAGTLVVTTAAYTVSAASDSKDVKMLGVDSANVKAKYDDGVDAVRILSAGLNGSINDDDMNESDEEIVEGMEVDNDIPVVELPDTVGGLDAPSARQGQTGQQFRSEDSSEDNSHASVKDELDREFACVSKSPIISYQPSIFALVGIGAIRQGTFFESESANKVMSDLSHLGLLHSKGKTCLVEVSAPDVPRKTLTPLFQQKSLRSALCDFQVPLWSCTVS
jgi:hypothetical protein